MLALAQLAKQINKIYRANKEGFSLRDYKERPVRSIISKRYYNVIVSVRNIFPHLADVNLKFAIQTQRRGEQLEAHAAVSQNYKTKPTYNRTRLSSH